MVAASGRRAASVGAGAGVLAALALFFVGCGDRPTPQEEVGARPAAMTDEGPLEVLVVGCQALGPGPSCVRGADDRLRLWAPVHPDRPIEIEIEIDADGAPTDAEIEESAADLGQRVVLRPPPAAATVVLRTPGRAPWRLSLTTEGTGESEAADAPARARGEAARARGDLAFRGGDLEGALAEYAAAFDDLRAAGRLLAASDVALTATFACAEILVDEACASAWLARHAALTEALPEARVRHAYYRGLVAERRGELQQALVDYDEHATLAGRLGLSTEAFAALSAEAVLRGRIGDLAGSAAAVARGRALADAVDPRERGRFLNNTAWTWVLAREHGLASDDPRALLREALAIFAADGPRPEPGIAAHVRVNLALAELQSGELAAARALLDALEAAPPGRRQALWAGYARARAAALAGDHGEAARRLGEALADARDDGAGDLEVLARVERGRALIALDRREEALGEFLAAERALDRQLAALAVDGGRERFAATHDRSAREATSLLVALGRPREALCVARLARSRTFEALARLAPQRGPDDRALARYRSARATIEAERERSFSLPRRDGELLRAALATAADQALRELDAALAPIGAAPVARATCEELARPETGELLIAWVPGAEGWLGFADDGRRLAVAHVAPPTADAPLEAWSDALLAPFAAQVAAAQRLRVIASGRLLAAPIDELPVAGAPLRERVAVAHTLDLPRPAMGPGGERWAGRRQALVLAPPSNLAGASAEAETIDAVLELRGWAPLALRGDAASGAAVREELTDAALLHFVGHADDRASLAWDAALELAGGSSLTVADLLALPAPAPPMVVLNGCRTGLADPDAAAGGMSLAHALLVAGAEAVVATTAEIDDAEALALGVAFYEALGAGPPARAAPAALAAALATLPPDAAARSRYRVWVR